MAYTPSTRVQTQIETTYTWHDRNAEQRTRIGNLKQAYADLATETTTLCPEGRELSLALTTLEQSMLHAVTAIEREPKEADTDSP